MYQDLRISNLVLRLSLAFVFLWFGIDKFIDPQYWLNAWVPQSIVDLAAYANLTPANLVYLIGIFEILVGLSLVTNTFIGAFASLALVFLAVIPFFHGFNEVIVRDVAIGGGLLALLVWPRPRRFL